MVWGVAGLRPNFFFKQPNFFGWTGPGVLAGSGSSGTRPAKEVKPPRNASGVDFPQIVANSRLQQGSGSWFELNLSCWIQIHIQNADSDPDPGGQKLSTKIEKSKEI